MGHLGHVPLDFQQFIFSVNLRAAQSLTATLCGCLSKHILYSATAAAVVQSRLHEHVQCRPTGWPKKFGTIILYALTLLNINRFSKLFHYQNQEKICNNTITKDPTIPQVYHYTTL